MRTEADAENHIRLKVQDDVDFRNRLIRNPRAVILAETGVELSDEKLTFVNEEIRKGLSRTSETNEPLTEEELAKIAGGLSWNEWVDSMENPTAG